MVGLEVGDKALFTKKYFDELSQSHGPINDFIVSILKFMTNISTEFGSPGPPMYDPSAVAVTIDSTLANVQEMHVDVETRGAFTRGETVANRHGEVERSFLRGDRYVIEGVDKVTPNAKVCVDVDADRFLQLFVSKIRGK
jgi:inosine-uridine nucleoside N-ribohydrolase